MGETYREQEAPLLYSQKAESTLNRTGTVWTAVAHIITAVIGSGVLSLAWSLSQLGWIAGPVAMLAFASITLISAFLLCNCYKSPDPEHGPTRNRTYLDAVEMNLGKKAARVCGICVHIGLYGFTIAYTVTCAISMRAIKKSNCYHKEGHGAACDYGDTLYMILFGVFQILLSQIPDFHNIQWLSIVAAIMSFAYSLIGFALGFAAVTENGHIKGNIWGASTSSAAEKVWLISQGLGDIAFAYPFSLVLIDIQDTLKSPPAETETMKKASTISLVISTAFYLLCGGFGYAAFGENTPGNLLTGFGFYEPYWLIDFANACIVAHLLGGYQLYSQPLFGNVEKWFVEKYPNSKYVTDDINLKLPLLPGFRLSLFRLYFRSLFVVSTTAIAMIFPYFNQIIGVLGGFIYWPLSIYFPVEMYFKQKNIEAWTTKWIVLRTFSLGCLLITSFALIGSIEGLIAAKLS
ncbi:probable amino acid permease 7 [Tripterygium wilfordii]|uniref:probable amino acid permease 7 n=1 Tax=Tripterygium wilfordii TaxID=458696 RepID=UPI0018F85B2D|nr:probable amino acid permease 7 [Tripterygium wilfordii]